MVRRRLSETFPLKSSIRATRSSGRVVDYGFCDFHTSVGNTLYRCGYRFRFVIRTFRMMKPSGIWASCVFGGIDFLKVFPTRWRVFLGFFVSSSSRVRNKAYPRCTFAYFIRYTLFISSVRNEINGRTRRRTSRQGQAAVSVRRPVGGRPAATAAVVDCTSTSADHPFTMR